MNKGNHTPESQAISNVIIFILVATLLFLKLKYDPNTSY